VQLPHFTTTTFTGRRVLVDDLINPQPDSITLDSSNTDSGSTPAHRFREGNVVVYKTSAKTFVEADDATGDQQTPAAVASLVTNPGGAGWNGTLRITGHWGTIDVTLSGDNTDAAVAAAITAAVAAQNPETQARITAADTTGEVTITNMDKGAGTWLHVVHTTVTTAFGASGTSAAGTDPDVRVTAAKADLKDDEGTAINADVVAYRTGHFYLPNLVTGGAAGIPAQARAVLEKRGARFSS
jgi:hypothetical protein